MSSLYVITCSSTFGFGISSCSFLSHGLFYLLFPFLFILLELKGPQTAECFICVMPTKAACMDNALVYVYALTQHLIQAVPDQTFLCHRIALGLVTITRTGKGKSLVARCLEVL